MTKEKLAEIISTVFYLGKSKYAPGTIGSLSAFPLFILLLPTSGIILIFANYFIHFVDESPNASNIPVNIFIGYGIILCLFWLIIFVIGVYFSDIYAKNIQQQDPKEIVIDEVAGQLLTIILCIPSFVLLVNSPNLASYFHNMQVPIFLTIVPFILFRFFDIVKPWPISWVDQNIKGGLGIMLDDLLAGVFAVITQYLFILLIVKYLK